MISSAEIPIYRFEDVEVDVVRGRINCCQEERHLRQKAFAVLTYLLENRERVISKDELIAQVWNGTAVVDDVLVQCIKDIRRALDDDPHRPRFIRTIPKLGYRFISPVVEVPICKTVSNVEQITRVELEIEEQSNLFERAVEAVLASRVKTLIAYPGALLLIAGIALISVAAGLFYLSPRLFGATNTEIASSMPLTHSQEALRYYSLGVERAQALHNEEALDYFEKALGLDPEFAMAHARIGYVYALTWAYPEKAKPYFERALNFSSRLSEKDKLQIEAWSAIAGQDYPAAIPPLQELISRFPYESEAYWRLGRILSSEGQNQEAIEVLEQGLAVDPEAKDIYNFLGGLKSLLGKHEEAIALQKRYVELAPGEPNAYDSLGMAYQHSGSYAEAAVQYQRALDLKPDFEIAIAHLANTRFQQGRYGDAIDLYRKYLTVAPSETEQGRGHSRISIIYCLLGDFAKADREAEIAQKYNREDFAALFVAIHRGDLVNARTLEKQLFARPQYSSRGTRTDSRVKFYLEGMLALKSGHNDEAFENFKQIQRFLPPTWDLLDFENALANGYFAAGQFLQSVEEYQRILEGNSNYPLARFQIARAYEKMGQPELALQNYRHFLELWKDADPAVPEVIAAKKKLR